MVLSMSRKAVIFYVNQLNWLNQTVENYLAQDSFDWGELKGAVRDEVAKFLFDQTKRRPAILPVVMEVR